VSSDKTIILGGRLKTVCLVDSGPSPLGGGALRAELEKSYQKGYEDATVRYNSELLEMRRQMQEHADGVLQRIQSEYRELTGNLSTELVDILGVLLYKILGQGAMDASIMRARIEAVVTQSCPANEPVEVQLCEPDFKALKGMDPEFASRYQYLSFKISDKLSAGDCLMKTRFGEVDARLKTQFKQLLGELESA